MRCLLALLAVSAIAEDLPPHILNLARIQRRMGDELKRLPNYTCLETIDRYRALPGQKMKPYDRVRINVAVVGTKELYAWPGAKGFDDRKLAQLLGVGFVSDGDFSVMTRAIFVNRAATITWVAAENIDGRDLLHYDFYMPQLTSVWTLHAGRASSTLAARGSFWTDAKTLDLVRLRFAGEELPSFAEIKSIDESTDFVRTKLGDAYVLLPATVDVHGEGFDRKEDWNHATFSSCREYSANSTISFGDETAAVARNRKPSSEIDIAVPGGLDIPLRLETAIDTRKASVGDEIRATVMKTIRDSDETIALRGDTATGVIQMFQRHVGNRPYVEVGIEFTEIESQGRRAVLFGELRQVSQFRGFHKNVVGFADGPPPPPRPRGVGYFYVEGPEIPKGTVLTLETQTVRTR